MNSLAATLAHQAALRPEACAIAFEGRRISYAQLQARVLATAHRAQAAGVRPGDRVAWLGLNHPGMLSLLFALARLRAVLLPINFRLAAAEWDALIGLCAPRFIAHDGDQAPQAAALAARHGLCVLEPGGLPRDELHADEGTLDAPALIVSTSGTTGEPRAAVHTQGQLLANMRIAAEVQELSPRDKVLTVLPLFHVGGLCIQTLPALHAGAQVLLQARFDAGNALAAIEHERPTLTLLVPATMKALTEHPRWAAADLGSLRAVWAGSSLLPPPLVAAFHARGLPVCNVYGATETGPFSIALPPAHAVAHAGSCGWPAPGVEARLANLRDGVGELLLRGPNVVRRYWPDTPACDAEGWFASGDLACRDEAGRYTIVGRVKELIISGGENIHPAEIESVLAEHPAVRDCAAFGMADAQWGEAVAVAVVLKPGAQADEQDLREHLAGKLARYKLPRRWCFVTELPKTALGKVQRGELAKLSPGPPPGAGLP